ncbi:hypothetical protein BC332_15820 [Capsicum chinense]|nr:hypothetical protein BC332_15820 [Capsicum chinense]
MEEVEGVGRRHKLVQSTLFPNSAKQIPVKGGAEVEEEEEEDAEEEEWCASQENGNKGKPKPRKKRNPKATTPHSNSRASKKVMSSSFGNSLWQKCKVRLHTIDPCDQTLPWTLRIAEALVYWDALLVSSMQWGSEDYLLMKVAVNGRETSSKEMPDGDSPVIIKNDFFLKRSEKKNQKRQQTEQLYSESPEKIQTTCSPPEFIANKRTPRSKKKLARSTPEKCQMDNKARKNMQINGLTEACLIPRNLMQDESMLHSIPDLRMEAKKTAEHLMMDRVMLLVNVL